MRLLRGHRSILVRLTDERLAHILEHPEMKAMEGAIEQTLLRPEYVVQSSSDPDAHLYYRFFPRTQVGEKYLCVVVKVKGSDSFVLTAYLTDTVKKGEVLWSEKP